MKHHASETIDETALDKQNKQENIHLSNVSLGGRVNNSFADDNLDKVLKPLDQNTSSESSLSNDVNSEDDGTNENTVRNGGNLPHSVNNGHII
jgi:hypothetical protein